MFWKGIIDDSIANVNHLFSAIDRFNWMKGYIFTASERFFVRLKFDIVVFLFHQIHTTNIKTSNIRFKFCNHKIILISMSNSQILCVQQR